YPVPMTNKRSTERRGAAARAALLTAIALLFLVNRGSASEWAPLPRMLLGRSGYTATLLPSGKVLIAGGDADHTAELYDPDTAAFAATHNGMIARRSGHTATLLPTGKVLLAGGDLSDPSEPLLVSTAELYDPATDTFTPVGPMLALHRHHTATL